MPTLQNTVIVLKHVKGVIENRVPGAAFAEDLMKIARHLERVASGNGSGVDTVDVHRGSTDAAPVAASGTVTLAGTVTGNQTVTINGVAITVAAGASDTLSAAALATAINASANALVQGIVSASSALGVVTVTALQKGKVGNAITLASSTAGAGTSTASGARLTGGVGGDSTSVRTFKG